MLKVSLLKIKRSFRDRLANKVLKTNAYHRDRRWF